jgi:hypothetical protein
MRKEISNKKYDFQNLGYFTSHRDRRKQLTINMIKRMISSWLPFLLGNNIYVYCKHIQLDDLHTSSNLVLINENRSKFQSIFG